MRIITYGTFDTLHYGHVRLLKRAKALGSHLTVALSSDEFNEVKGKKSNFPWTVRKQDLLGIRYVDEVINEANWEQKVADVRTHNIDIFVMGDDWSGEFDYLKEVCSVVYLPRTEDISSTLIRTATAPSSRISEKNF
jgi:glycerol-3-phosphate cytidylyltransferase